MVIAEEYHQRVRALIVRGLTGPLAYDVVYLGDVSMLEQLEGATDEDLAKVSRLYEERQQLHEAVPAGVPMVWGGDQA